MENAERRALLAAHHAALERFVRRLGSNQHEADELFQDTSVIVLEHPCGPTDASSFLSWCRGIARHLAAHRRRGFARLHARFAPWDGREWTEGMVTDPLTLEDPERLAIAREQVALGLERLGEVDVALLVARFVDDETPAEIAKRWNVTPASMRMRIMRLRRLLRADADKSPS